MNSFINARNYSCYLICAMLLSNTAHATANLSLPDERNTDQVVKSDQQTYKQMQARVAALNEQGTPVADYHLSKAQCWLDVSLHEYTRNDRTAFPQEALSQADGILSALEAKQLPGTDTPLVNNADRLREDLWQRTASLKQAKGFSCYAQKVACAEVELVHAGNEHKQQGWRHAKPYIQIVEDLVAEATATGDSCLPPAPAQIVAAVVPQPPVQVVEYLDVAADALFSFDKAGIDDLLPEGKTKLDELVAKLKDIYAQIDYIRLVGHTDRLGSEQYNQLLSEHRANTVKEYLRANGITNLIDVSGRGETEPLVECGAANKPSKMLTDCLQPNRRVSVEVKGVRKQP